MNVPRRLSITWQLTLLFLFALVLMAAGTTASVLQSFRMEMGAKKSQVLAIDAAAKSIAEYYVGQVQSGGMSTPAAQRAALHAVGALRYDGQNYVFIYGYDGTVLAHHDKSLIGKNRFNAPDAAGKVYLPAMLHAAQAGQIFFQHYHFPRMPGGKPVPKLSAMVAVPEWGWALGTGVYIDDVYAAQASALEQLAVILIPLLALYLTSALFARQQISTMLRELSRAMHRLQPANWKLKSPVPTARMNLVPWRRPWQILRKMPFKKTSWKHRRKPAAGLQNFSAAPANKKKLARRQN